jgi:hypothetical protein
MKEFIKTNFHNLFWLIYSILILKYVNFVFSKREFNILDLGFISIIILLYLINFILEYLQYRLSVKIKRKNIR